MKNSQPGIISFLLLFCLTFVSAVAIESGRNGAIASVDENATQTGIDILRQGGNAFDAAVAVAFCLAVVYPQAGNIGGGGFIVLRDQSGQMGTLDFREVAPATADKNMYLDKNGAVIQDLSLLGPLAAGVPATVAGMYELHQKYGVLSWDECLKPSILFAQNGFLVNQKLHDDLVNNRDKIFKFPEAFKIFFPHGRIPEVGELLIQSDLAKVLSEISIKGKKGFYTGWVAQQITEYMVDSGGLITVTDLLSYQPTWRSPHHISFNGFDIYSMPAPSSGGITMHQILGMTEPFLSKKNYRSNSVEYIHLLAEAEKRAFADRNYYLADPDCVKIPVATLTDSTYMHDRLPQIPESATPANQISEGTIPGFEHDETTHFSIVDYAGNAVSCTYTLNGVFGSKAVVPGTGILLNNEMDDFTVKPGEPNMFGLVMGSANKIECGKRMLSSMSPTIVLKNDSLLFLTGSPGGSRIISTVLQTILNICYFDENITEALEKPRFHHQWLPDYLVLEEKFKNDDILINNLKNLGYRIKFRKRLGNVHAISVKSSYFYPASDNRIKGSAIAF